MADPTQESWLDTQMFKCQPKIYSSKWKKMETEGKMSVKEEYWAKLHTNLQLYIGKMKFSYNV